MWAFYVPTIRWNRVTQVKVAEAETNLTGTRRVRMNRATRQMSFGSPHSAESSNSESLSYPQTTSRFSIVGHVLHHSERSLCGRGLISAERMLAERNLLNTQDNAEIIKQNYEYIHTNTSITSRRVNVCPGVPATPFFKVQHQVIGIGLFRIFR